MRLGQEDTDRIRGSESISDDISDERINFAYQESTYYSLLRLEVAVQNMKKAAKDAFLGDKSKRGDQ